MRDSSHDVRLSYDGFFIDGRWRHPAGGRTWKVIGPATGRVLGSVPLAESADVDDAVAAARRALVDGRWGRSAWSERAAALRRLAAAVSRRADEFATVLALDAGTPVSGNATIPAAVARLTYFADLVDGRPDEEFRNGVLRNVLVRSEPVGVVGAILPWNAPMGIGFMKLAPALAAGCTIVVKTAPEAPLCWNLIGEVLAEADIPPGVVNVLCADREVSELLVRHPDVDKISFTGSTAVGRKVGAICGTDLKRCSLELGGKSAAVILDDVDLDEALPRLVRAATSNNGQACVLQSRVLVPRSRSEEITEAFADRVASLTVGDPLDPRTDVGPLITEAHRERVESYVAAGRAEGAEVVTGGGRPPHLDDGWWVEPTVFRGVDPAMKIAREEIFGPVVAIIGYDTVDEAISISNATEYGLSGTVWTTDPARGVDVARAVRAGNFGINVFGMDVSAPFGGMKNSGIGREMGPEGLAEYVEYKSIHLPDGWEGG